MAYDEPTIEDVLMESETDEMEPETDTAPGEDVPVASYDGMTVVQAILRCQDESEDARMERERLNEVNNDAYHCRQSFEGKVAGQSAEFVPKVPMAVEQLAAFVKRGMDSFNDYFAVELSPNPSLVGGPLTDAGVVNLIRHRIESPEQLAPGALDFPTLVSDGVKVASLQAYMVFKVCGTQMPTSRYVTRPVFESVEVTDPGTGEVYTQDIEADEELVMEEGKVWRLVVELIRPEDYYPDPTGRGLYEIHRTRKDLYQVIDEAEAGHYDEEAVAALAGTFQDFEVDQEIEAETNQPTQARSDFRKEVEILEFWGTLLDSDGNVAHRNCRAVVANQQFLLRKPEPNPYWHQESPFVVIAPLRVPFSVFHKALFDYAVRINLAMNELYNLIVDGGIGSVWGNRQVKMSRVENAEDFSDGIPQGATFIVSENHPDGQPVVMNTPSGVVPPEAMGVYQLMDREFSAASMMSSTAMGQTPRKEVSATATASADQSTGMFFDDWVKSIESGVRKVIRLAWLTMLQNADDWDADDTEGCIGPEAARALATMSAARRFATYAQGAKFRVNGLTSMLARTREFQKVMSVIQVMSQSPMLGQVAMTEMSPKKIFHHLLRSINLDPDDLKITPEEQATLQERVATLSLFGQGGGATGPAQMQANPTQQPGNPTQQTQAAIAQQNQPPQAF